MKPFTSLKGTAAPLTDNGQLMANVDTDMIIPKQFLKTTERVGLSKGLFHELKTLPNGRENPDFVLNKPTYKGVSILIAGDNFGCGSSREHAPWALLDRGITCVIAPGFADIFHNNCYKNGMLPIALPVEVCNQLTEQSGGANHVFEIDLAAQTVTAPDGMVHHFEVDEGRKANLLAGLDEIGTSMKSESAIADYESHRRLMTPWLEPAQ
ncbi:MAG: 3-isopropylmalate dehydratase small subunit [Pseudomonadota bacterium]